MDKEKNLKKGAGAISRRIWVLISFLLALVVLQLLSVLPSTSIVFSSPVKIVQSFLAKSADGTIWMNIGMSLFRVVIGFLLGFVISIPIAFLMSWYKVFRNLVEPWIQFIRNIPPLAYIPLVIAGVGVGESAKVVVIFIATFLVNVITVGCVKRSSQFQGSGI